jgi:hypothetical protein
LSSIDASLSSFIANGVEWHWCELKFFHCQHVDAKKIKFVWGLIPSSAMDGCQMGVDRPIYCPVDMVNLRLNSMGTVTILQVRTYHEVWSQCAALSVRHNFPNVLFPPSYSFLTPDIGMFPVTILWSVRYGPMVMVTISLMHLAITFWYGYSSVHEPSTPVRYSCQRLYMVTVPLVNTYSMCKIYSLDPSYVSNTQI